jgi:hypothetical protein
MGDIIGEIGAATRTKPPTTCTSSGTGPEGTGHDGRRAHGTDLVLHRRCMRSAQSRVGRICGCVAPGCVKTPQTGSYVACHQRSSLAYRRNRFDLIQRHGVRLSRGGNASSACPPGREVVGLGRARRYDRLETGVSDPVLLHGRRLPVPVDNGRFTDFVGQGNGENAGRGRGRRLPFRSAGGSRRRMPLCRSRPAPCVRPIAGWEFPGRRRA